MAAPPEYLAAASGALVPLRKFLRLGNWAFDVIAFVIASFLMGIPFGILWALAGGSFEDDDPAFNAAGSILGLATFLGYYVILEATVGRTVGKLLTGSRVVREDGGKPRIGQILGRTAARLIPFEPFSVLLTVDGVGWHDKLSGTRVVKVKPGPNA